MSWSLRLFLFAVSCPAGLVSNCLSAHGADGFWPSLPTRLSLSLPEGSDWPGRVTWSSPNQSLWLRGLWFASWGHVLTPGIKEVSSDSSKSKGLNGITVRWGARLPREGMQVR